MGSDFIKSTSQKQVRRRGLSCWGNVVALAQRFQSSNVVSNFMVLAVLFDSYCTCSDIDARAAGNQPPAALLLLSDCCLLFYTVELGMACITAGWLHIIRDWTVLLDVVIILCGYAELFLNAVAPGDGFENLTVLRALRLARIVRLMRLLRRTRALRELQKLVHMMATCLKALFWSFVFCLLIMTVWAMFMVEIVHPLIVDMNTNKGYFEDCPQCVRATSSVMDANLLLVKTVIAGDSWGTIAVPVIEENPLTALIFIGSLFTLLFGVLNLIVAVVVDTFAEARQRDILNLAEEMEYDSEKDKKLLQTIFDRMDKDGSGEVTYEDLLDGARRDTEFQSRLRVMDIDENDLLQLFEMIDVTNEGSIKADEFIAPLSRWVHDSKTAPRFIKYNLMRALEQQEELYIFCQDYFDNLGGRMDFLVHALKRLYENNSSAMSPPPTPGMPRRPEWEADAVPGPKSPFDGLAEDECLSVVSKHSENEVEQPHRSKKPMWKADANQVVKSAMETLESCVLKATETALKSSLARVESTLREQLRCEIPEIGKMKPAAKSTQFPRLSEFQRLRDNAGKAGRSSSNSGSSFNASVSVAGASTALQSFALRDRSVPRRPMGTFSPPKQRDGSKESAEDESPTASISASRRIGSKQSGDDRQRQRPLGRA